MTLNELRPGHQRIADIYGLPVNIVRDPLNGKFTAWLGQPGTSGAGSGPIVETIVPQKPPEVRLKDHDLKRAMLTRVLLGQNHEGGTRSGPLSASRLSRSKR